MTSAEYYMYLADKAIGQKGIKEASGPLITRVFCTDLTIGHRWRDMLLRRGWQAASMACSLWSIVFTTRLHGQQSRYQTRSSDVGVDVESAARSGFTSGLFQQQMVDTDRRCSSSCTFAVPRRQQEVDSRTAATDARTEATVVSSLHHMQDRASRLKRPEDEMTTARNSSEIGRSFPLNGFGSCGQDPKARRRRQMKMMGGS